MKKKTKVLVAMSGGVDSSVAAALLLKEGYEVIGLTMKLLSNEEILNDKTNCCSLSAVEDARQVAKKLSIPHYVFNFQNEFENIVIKNFVNEYLKGRTPNPCIVCNRRIKFDSLLRKAIGMGMDYIATGHYANIKYDEESSRYLLLKGKDKNKDQSYSLYALTQNQLSKTLFPLGKFSDKFKIRQLAEEFNLPVAQKSESQEICFVVDDDYRRFIRERVNRIEPGYFLDTKGNIIGEHEGIPFYTIGQRKGLGLALGYPVYVVDIDYNNNCVIVGSEEEVFDDDLIAENNNFIPFDVLDGSLRCSVKVRYRTREAPAVIKPIEGQRDRIQAIFDQPQKAITPGQAAVYYNEDVVLGGGTIVKAK